MDHQSDDRGRQLFSANASRLGKHSWIKRADHLLGLVQSFVYFGEQRQSSRPWIHLVRDCSQLFRRELLAAEVSSQTLNAARDMAEMKTYRREAMRP